MKITTFCNSLKALLNPNFLLQLAKKTGFTTRMRVLNPAHLVCAIIQTLSIQRNANLADILRTLASDYQVMDNYKPFHNQMKKETLTQLMQKLTEDATRYWLLEPFKNALPDKYPFKYIHLHDGSSLTLHPALRETFPGRFTRTAPAAIELHLTLDLVTGAANYLGIDADKESERLYQPYAHELKETLVLMDAGYFDINYCHDIQENGGFYIIRAKNNINPTIHDDTGKTLVKNKINSLKNINIKKNEVKDLTISWKKRPAHCRLIAFWDRKNQQKGYIMTNLHRADFSAQDICRLYGLRWQVELFFKELKSFCNLATFNTRDKNIVLTLVWGSMLALLLKRYVAFSTGMIHNVLISSHKVARCSQNWLKELLVELMKPDKLESVMQEIMSFLVTHGQRAYPKRDKETLLLTIGLAIYPVTN